MVEPVAESVKTTEPVKIVKSKVTDTTKTTKITEPVKIAESVKIVEPVKIVDTIKITEPVKITEPIKITNANANRLQEITDEDESLKMKPKVLPKKIEKKSINTNPSLVKHSIQL